MEMQEGTGGRVRSAVDGVHGVTLAGTALLVVACALALAGPAGAGVWLATAPVAGLAIWLLADTWYELREDHLYARSGPFRERIPYERIRLVRLCENLWSSMALSSQRIEVRQRGRGWITGTTYISPRDREGFIEALVARCPNLEERGA